MNMTKAQSISFKYHFSIITVVLPVINDTWTVVAGEQH